MVHRVVIPGSILPHYWEWEPTERAQFHSRYRYVVALATVDCRAYKFARMRVLSAFLPLPSHFATSPGALAGAHAVIAVASCRSLTLRWTSLDNKRE